MEDILELIDFERINMLIESIKQLAASLMNFFYQIFSWLGSGVLAALTVGIAIAIILRILGR